MRLSWIIPAYNEERRIEKSLREVVQYLGTKSFEWEILVIDNSSQDQTGAIVARLARELPGIRLVTVREKGKGGAVKLGMLKASGDIRLFSDADNSVSPEHFDAMLPYFEKGYDAVIGSIEVPGAFVEEQAQWYRRALGKFAKLVIRVVSGLWEIHDSQRGFKAFTRRAAEAIFPRSVIKTWGFDFEVLLIAKKHGFKTKEIPVRWINPPDSKVGLGAYVSTMRELLQVKMNDLRGLYD